MQHIANNFANYFLCFWYYWTL